MELSCLFWIVWKAKNGIVFWDNVLSIQKLKTSFLILLWLENTLSIVDSPLTLGDFIARVRCK